MLNEKGGGRTRGDAGGGAGTVKGSDGRGGRERGLGGRGKPWDRKGGRGREGWKGIESGGRKVGKMRRERKERARRGE